MSCINNCTCEKCCPEVSGDNGCLSESLPLKCTHYSAEDLPTVNITKADTGDDAIKKLVQAIEAINTSDKFVKISVNDSTASYLANKLVKGTYTTITKQNPGLNETLKIDVDLNSILHEIPQSEDKFVKVSTTDANAGYLENKLEGTQYIVVSRVPGEKMQFSLDYDSLTEALNIIPDSYKFKIDSSDSTADFLTSKLLADNSSGVVFVKNNNGANESVTIGLDLNVIHNLLGLDNINVPLTVSSPSNTVLISQGGNANHTVTLDAKLSVVAGNQLTNNAGLYVPAHVDIPVEVGDSSTIDLTSLGTLGHTITASAKISQEVNNALTDNAGLYVPQVIANDSDTIDFSQSGNTFTGSVKISAQPGNALSNNVGLYAPTAFNNFPTATSFNPSTGVLNIDRSGLSPISTNLDGRYYPMLGLRSQNTINESGWFRVAKEDTANPFHNVNPNFGSGASGFASYEGVGNGWILVGQDGLNTITGQSFDLYGALRNSSGGFYPAVRMWHSDNVAAGSGIGITQNSFGQFVISNTGSSTSVVNGLRTVGNTFRLGGDLTENTLISNNLFDLGIASRKVVMGNLYTDVYGSSLGVNNTRALFVRTSSTLNAEGSGSINSYHNLILNGTGSFGSGRGYVATDSALRVTSSATSSVLTSSVIAAQYNLLQIENTAAGNISSNPTRPIAASMASVQPLTGYAGNTGKVDYVAAFATIPLFQTAGGNNFTEITNYSGLFLAPSDEVVIESLKLVNKFGVNQAGSNDLNIFKGNISYYGSLTNASDLRIKEDISNYSKGLDIINSVRVVDFEYSGTYKRGDQRHIGVIAQELEQILPEAVKTIKEGDLEDFRTVDQSVLLFTAINAIKALSQEINQLKAK